MLQNTEYMFEYVSSATISDTRRLQSICMKGFYWTSIITNSWNMYAYIHWMELISIQNKFSRGKLDRWIYVNFILPYQVGITCFSYTRMFELLAEFEHRPLLSAENMPHFQIPGTAYVKTFIIHVKRFLSTL